jgi:hypothetical protein
MDCPALDPLRENHKKRPKLVRKISLVIDKVCVSALRALEDTFLGRITMNPHTPSSGRRAKEGNGTAKIVNEAGLPAAAPQKENHQLDPAEKNTGQHDRLIATGILLESAVADMNKHILSPGCRVRKGDSMARMVNMAGLPAASQGKNHPPDSVEENIGQHDVLIVAGILLALVVIAMAFWSHPVLTALSMAAICALTKSVASSCKIHARWRRLHKQKHLAHSMHLKF